MSSASDSITSALRGLKPETSNPDVYLAELIRLADLDEGTDTFARGERIFALRRRIRMLQQRVRELESAK